MAIAVSMNILGINLKQSLVIHLVFFTNLGLCYFSFHEITTRYGIDYIAYI